MGQHNFKKFIRAKGENRRVYLWEHEEDKYSIGFSVIDKDYKGIDKYVIQKLIRNKVVFTQLSVSKFAAYSLMTMLAQMLGYTVCKNNQDEQLICPHCARYKTMQGNGIIHQLCECKLKIK